jgi:3-isopropylmalate/(R)-2-methylmalate dehydratase small subunit
VLSHIATTVGPEGLRLQDRPLLRVAGIFRGNSRKQSLLAAELAQDDIELIRKELENAPGNEVTVDLVSKTVICGNIVAPFEIDDYTR